MAKIISKLLLFVFNVIYFLAAVAILVLGSLSLSGETIILDLLDLIHDTSLVVHVLDWKSLTTPAAIYLVTLGSLAVVLSFIGCFGAFKDHKLILIFFAVSKLCIILFNLALIIYNAVVPFHGQGQVTDLLKENLEMNFEPISLSGSDSVMMPSANSSAWYWAKMEFEHACCAAENSTDYSDVFESFNGSTINTGTQWVENAKVSATCCMQVIQYKIPNTTAEFVDVNACIASTMEYANYRGCSDYVMSVILAYRQIYIITAAVFIALEVIVIVLTVRVSDKRRSVGSV